MRDHVTATTAGQLYPPLTPRTTGYLRVSEVHELYCEESGSPDGIPAVFLHGGPGTGTTPYDRRVFDPERYRIVLFDQRGAGKSRKKGCLEDNTTPLLIADIERLREHLGVERWLVVGGSWGSSLGMAYCAAHPASALGLVMWGVFLGRRWELDAAYTDRGGAAWVRPIEHQQFLAQMGGMDRSQPVHGYWALLQDETTAAAAAREWTRWEELLTRLEPHLTEVDQALQDQEQCDAAAIVGFTDELASGWDR